MNNSIPTNTLIIIGVDSFHFNSNYNEFGLNEIKKLTIGCKKLISLKAFKRFLIIYESVQDASIAKARLHGWVLTNPPTESLVNIAKDTNHTHLSSTYTLRVYFGAHTDLKWLSTDPKERMTFLTLPQTSRNFLLSPPGSPSVGWVQTTESEPSKGGFTFPQDLQDARIASEISLLDFTLDGGVEVEDEGNQMDRSDSIKINVQEKREKDGVAIRVVKFDSLESGLELPIICISGDESVDVGLDSSILSRIPQTSLPPRLL